MSPVRHEASKVVARIRHVMAERKAIPATSLHVQKRPTIAEATRRMREARKTWR